MGFVIFLVFCYLIYVLSKFVFESHKKAKAKIRTLNLDLFFVKTSKFRKKDDEIQKGDCIFDFQEDIFTIKQGDKKIGNDISSIYLFRFWEYEEYIYFAINMRSKTEYMFSLKSDFQKKLITYLAENHNIMVENS